jgi:hypothetical protein
MNRRRTVLLLLMMTFSLVLLLSACQTFNISILIPTESVPTEGVLAVTLPAQWTPTPIPEYLRPLELLTPLAPEDYTTGPDWQDPQILDFLPEGIFELGQFVNFTKVVGDWLIVGDNAGILTLLDLFDPMDPIPIANIFLGYEERILALEPGDPFSPPDPFIAAEIRDVEFEDGFLYVITLHRLIVFDVTDPYEPRFLGQYELPPRVNDLTVEDAYVRVLVSDTRGNNVHVIEIDAIDPDHIFIDYDSPLPDTVAGRAQMQGDLGFVTKRILENAEHLKLYDLSELGYTSKLGEAYGAPAFKAWVENGYAYISTARVEIDSRGGYYSAAASIWVVDITNPEDPESFSYIWTPDIATGFHLTEEYAYAIGGDLRSAFGETGDSYWMVVADISDPEFPIVFRTLDLPGQGLYITGEREIVYVAAGQAGLQILRPEVGEALKMLKGENLKAPTTVLTPDLPTSRTIATPLPTIWPGTPTPTPNYLFLTATPSAWWD